MRSLMICLFYLLMAMSLIIIGCEDDPKPPVEMVEEMAGAEEPPPPPSTIDERCPNVQASTQLLVLYPDRVDLFERDSTKLQVTKRCTFMALAERDGVNARGLSQSPTGNFLVIDDVGEQGAQILIYSNNGEYSHTVEPNINLAQPGGIWRIGDRFVVWSAATSNLYELDQDGTFIGPYLPPQQMSSRMSNVVELLDIGPDQEDRPRVLAIFTDRPPQLFAFPASPSIASEEVSGVIGADLIPTPVGNKLILSATLEGSVKGVVRYRQLNSGRSAPELEDTLVIESDEGFGNGADILSMEEGFYLLDTSNNAQGAILSSFSEMGVLQEQSVLGNEIPRGLYLESIFKDF